jgi:hypothetical protein
MAVVLGQGEAMPIARRSSSPSATGTLGSRRVRECRDPAGRQRYLLLKSRMYYRPVFLPIAKGSVLCDGVGVTWTQFTYRNIRRPIYPLGERAS